MPRQALRAVPESAWAGARLRPIKAFRLLSLRHAVAGQLEAAKHGHPAPPPAGARASSPSTAVTTRSCAWSWAPPNTPCSRRSSRVRRSAWRSPTPPSACASRAARTRSSAGSAAGSPKASSARSRSQARSAARPRLRGRSSAAPRLSWRSATLCANMATTGDHMRMSTVREFRDKATVMLRSRDPILVTRRGKLAGCSPAARSVAANRAEAGAVRDAFDRGGPSSTPKAHGKGRARTR